MAVAGTNLTTSSSTTDGTVFTTASVTPVANSLILIGIGYTPTTSPNPALTSVVGNGITYSQVATSTLAARTVVLFSGMAASPAAGAITITSPASLTSCLWSVFQFTGTDTSGTNGSGAIVQSAVASALTATNTPTVSFTATPNAANAGVGIVLSSGALTAGASGTGWNLAGNTNQTAPVDWLLSESADVACPSAITATFTGTAGTCWIVGAEILPAAPINPRGVMRPGRVPLLRAANF